MFECNRNYHCCDQCSCLIADKLPTQHPLVNLHVPLEEIEEEIIFYHADDDGEYDDEDVPMEIELCMSFGTHLFPHHDDSYSQQYLREIVPSSREVILIDGEPLSVTTEEPYVEKSAIGEPTVFGDPKSTITSSASDTYGLDRDPVHIVLSTPTSDGEQMIWENLAAGYTQDVNPQVLPDPPSYISLLPSDSINESIMAIVNDETRAHGTEYTQPHVCVKVSGYAQDFHLMTIPCATKTTALQFCVCGMTTSFPFDRGKMVSSLPLLSLCSLIANPTKALLSKPAACLPTSIMNIGRLFSPVTLYCLWGVTACICFTLHKPLSITVSTCTLTLPGYGLTKNPTSKFLQAQAKWLVPFLSLA